ncbi:MAG: anaerobic sulfatase maturase [Bacteroidales bacterium]
MIQDDFSSSYNSIAFPVYVMARSAGSKCNLNCIYCKKGSATDKMTDNAEMNRQVLEQFTKQYIDAQIHSAVRFFWTGGEPLLCGLDFYKDALHLQKKLGAGKLITNCMQTNATLLNDEWCSFLKQNDFQVHVALDGPQHCHDRYRIKDDGNGSFEDTMRGIELLQKYGINFQVKTTINSYNVQFPLEIYRFFKANGLRHVQFIPHVSSEGGRITEWSVPAVSYGNFLCDIFDEWIRRDVGQMFISIFENTLKVFCRKDAINCMYAPTCGHTAMADSNGDIYACNYFHTPEFKLGNIKESTITGMMYGRKQLRFGQQKRNGLSVQCKRCSYLRFCNGGCLKDRIGNSATGEKHHNALCAGYQKFFAHVSPAMIFMAEEITGGRNSSRVMSFFESCQD